jgi:hypothetical protein
LKPEIPADWQSLATVLPSGLCPNGWQEYQQMEVGVLAGFK